MKTVLIIALLIFSLPFSKGKGIHEAAKTGDLEEVKNLIEKDSSLLNLKDERGMIPLHYAIDAGQDQVALFLIDLGADLWARDAIYGATPFHYAAYKGNLDIARIIIGKNGSLLEEEDLKKKTPLLYACEGGQAGMVEYLLDCGANLQVRDQLGLTPLMTACAGWNMEVIRILVGLGIDVNEITVYQGREYTALTVAALYGFREMVDYLIDLKAEIPVSIRELTLQYAVQGSHKKLFDYVQEKGLDLREDNRGENADLIYKASAAGAKEIFNALVLMGYNFLGQDPYQWTVLHHAASRGNTEMIEFLLNLKGIDMNIRSKRGETAYDVADFLGYNEAKQYLKASGADTSGIRFPEITGYFMGQQPPGKTPEMFMPGIVSGPYRAHGTVVFSPDGKEAYWSDMIPGAQSTMEMKMIDGRWTYPIRSVMWKDPSMTPDGNRLIYISREPLYENDPGDKENYWYMDRMDSGWTEAKPMAPIINQINIHWQCSMDLMGNMYFSEFENNMYISESREGQYQDPINLKIYFNNPTLNGHSPFISPKGDYLVFADQGRLYVSFETGKESWTDRIDLGDEINSGAENGSPRVSLDGKYLFFQSTSGVERPWGIYWVSADIIYRLKKDLAQIN